MAFAKTDYNKNIYYVQGIPLLEAKRKIHKAAEFNNSCFSCKKRFEAADIEYKFRFLDGDIKDTTYWGDSYNYTYALTHWNTLCEDCLTKQIDRIKEWPNVLEQLRAKR